MTERTPTPQKPTTFPYTSFKSGLNVLQKFKDNGLPSRIDRSVLGGSEGQKTQIIATFRFLGFVKENGDVTDTLKAIVAADDKTRQQMVRDLLAKHYPDATALAAKNATTRQLEETFVGLGGDTLRKAVAFYLHAAKYSGHPVSKHFKIPPFIARNTASRRGAGNGVASSRGAGGDTPPPPPPSPEDDAKARYLDMLLKRAETPEGAADENLLNRIERLLGYQVQGPADADDDV